MIGLATVYSAALLLALGAALIVAELLIPSMGLLGLLAGCAIVAAVALAFGESGTLGVRFLIAAALLVPAAVALAFKLLPRSPLGRVMVARGLSFDSSPATDARDLELGGAEGEVESELRPTGIARLRGRRVDVITRGESIAAGERVRVLEISGNRIVVARVSAPDESPQRA